MAGIVRPFAFWLAILFGFALAQAALSGCATRGSSFPTDKIPRIEEGTTTRQEVDGWFGQPIQVKRETSGFSVYRYLHEDETTHDTGVLSRTVSYVGRLFGYGSYGTPVNVRYRNTIRHELVVNFDPDGIVASYSYERTDSPSKQIY